MGSKSDPGLRADDFKKAYARAQKFMGYGTEEHSLGHFKVA